MLFSVKDSELKTWNIQVGFVPPESKVWLCVAWLCVCGCECVAVCGCVRGPG